MTTAAILLLPAIVLAAIVIRAICMFRGDTADKYADDIDWLDDDVTLDALITMMDLDDEFDEFIAVVKELYDDAE